jgi:hypothetical protein
MRQGPELLIPHRALTIAAIIAVVAVNAVLISFGYGWVILLTTVGVILIDGLILRFQ